MRRTMTTAAGLMLAQLATAQPVNETYILAPGDTT